MNTHSSHDGLVPSPGSEPLEKCCPHPLKDHGSGVGCHRCSCTRRGPAKAQRHNPRLVGLSYYTLAGIALGVGCVAAVVIAAFVLSAGYSKRSTSALAARATPAPQVSKARLALAITPTPSASAQPTPVATPKPKRAKRRRPPVPQVEVTPAPSFVLQTPTPSPSTLVPTPPTAAPVCWGINSEGRRYRIPCVEPSP